MKTKVINQVFCLVVSLCMLFALLPTTAFAEESGISLMSMLGADVSHYNNATGDKLDYDVFPDDLIDMPETSITQSPDISGLYTPEIPEGYREFTDSETGIKYALAKIVIFLGNGYDDIVFDNLDDLDEVDIPADAAMVGLRYYWDIDDSGIVEPDPEPEPEPDPDEGGDDETTVPIVNWINSIDRSVVQNDEPLSASAGITPDTYVLQNANKDGITVNYSATMDMENLSSFFGGQSWAVLNQNAYGIDDSTIVKLHFVFDENVDVTSFDDDRFAAASLTSDMFQMDDYEINEANNELILICHWNTEGVIEQRNAYWAAHGGSVGNEVIFGNDFAFLDNMITLKNVQLDVKSDWEGESVQLTNNGYVDGYVYLRTYSDYATFPSITNDDFNPDDEGYVTAVGGPIDGGKEDDTFVLTTNGKISEPGLEKWIVTDDGKVEMDDVAAGTEVTFELDSNVPDNLGKYISVEVDDPTIKAVDATDSYQLIFLDTLDPMFSDPTDFVVKIGDTELTSDQYVLDLSNTHQFTVTLDLAALYHANVITNEDIQGATPITVTYTATLSEDATAESYTNAAQVVYPDGQSSMDMVWVKTYAIKVFKYDQATHNGLEGAQFVLTHKGSDGTDSQMLTSGEDGYIRVDGLDAGNYELREIKAPEGYVCSDEVLEIVVSAEEAGSDYIIEVEFANTLIPHTGGTGTVMYTVGGVAIIVLAGILLVVYRKSRKKQDR